MEQNNIRCNGIGQDGMGLVGVVKEGSGLSRMILDGESRNET